jgi:hypothetical protein
MNTDSLSRLVGKKIKSVVVNDRTGTGRSQLFLVCQDGTVVEVYGEINAAKTVMSGGEQAALDYITKSQSAGVVHKIR